MNDTITRLRRRDAFWRIFNTEWHDGTAITPANISQVEGLGMQDIGRLTPAVRTKAVQQVAAVTIDPLTTP